MRVVVAEDWTVRPLYDPGMERVASHSQHICWATGEDNIDLQIKAGDAKQPSTVEGYLWGSEMKRSRIPLDKVIELAECGVVESKVAVEAYRI